MATGGFVMVRRAHPGLGNGASVEIFDRRAAPRGAAADFMGWSPRDARGARGTAGRAGQSRAFRAGLGTVPISEPSG